MDLQTETFAPYLGDLANDESYKPYAEMKGIDLINGHKELTAKAAEWTTKEQAWGTEKQTLETQYSTEKQSYEERLANAIEPIPEDATDEDRADYLDIVRAIVNDAPDDPGKYQLNLREGVKPDDPLLFAVLAKAQETGMSNSQMQGVYDAVGSSVAAMETKALETTDTNLKALWGRDFDANVVRGMDTLRAIAKETGLDPDATMNQLGFMRRNEGFMRILHDLSRHYKEANISGTGGGPGPGGDTGLSAVDRLAERIKARSPQS